MIEEDKEERKYVRSWNLCFFLSHKMARKNQFLSEAWISLQRTDSGEFNWKLGDPNTQNCQNSASLNKRDRRGMSMDILCDMCAINIYTNLEWACLKWKYIKVSGRNQSSCRKTKYRIYINYYPKNLENIDIHFQYSGLDTWAWRKNGWLPIKLTPITNQRYSIYCNLIPHWTSRKLMNICCYLDILARTHQPSSQLAWDIQNTTYYITY